MSALETSGKKERMAMTVILLERSSLFPYERVSKKGGGVLKTDKIHVERKKAS